MLKLPSRVGAAGLFSVVFHSRINKNLTIRLRELVGDANVMKSDRNLEKTQQCKTSWDESQMPCAAKEPDTEVQDWVMPASCGPVVLKLRPGVIAGSRCCVGGLRESPGGKKHSPP